MPRHRGNRKAFNISVRQAPDYFNPVVSKKAEARAKNEPDLWFKICELLRYFWEYHSIIFISLSLFKWDKSTNELYT
jgi:hypothetical protein